MEEIKKYWYFGEKFRLYRLDEYNISIDEKIIVTSKTTKEQREEWDRKGYWSSLDMALKALRKYILLDTVENCNCNLEDIINYLNQYKVGIEKYEE